MQYTIYSWFFQNMCLFTGSGVLVNRFCISSLNFSSNTISNNQRGKFFILQNKVCFFLTRTFDTFCVSVLHISIKTIWFISWNFVCRSFHWKSPLRPSRPTYPQKLYNFTTYPTASKFSLLLCSISTVTDLSFLSTIHNDRNYIMSVVGKEFLQLVKSLYWVGHVPVQVIQSFRIDGFVAKPLFFIYWYGDLKNPPLVGCLCCSTFASFRDRSKVNSKY